MPFFASRSWMRLCLLLVTWSATSAIFEEQLGEFDWKRENIGLIDSSFFIKDQMIVATSDGVLASLNIDTGATKWRVVLPQQMEVVKFVEMDGQLATLMYRRSEVASNGIVESATVKCWSVVDGSLLWDSFLGTAPASVGSVDLMYVSSNKQLTVMFDNTLHFITVPQSQSVTASSWSWSVATDLSSTALTRGATRPDLRLALSSLIAPTYSAGQADASASADSISRTAVGCFVSATSSVEAAVCEGEVVVVRSGPRGKVDLEVFASLPEFHRVKPADLTAAVASQASVPYQANDVVFAVSRDGDTMTLPVLSLATDALLAAFPLPLPLPLQETAPATDSAVSTKAFVFVSADGELLPAVSVCSDSACRSLVATMAPASTSTSSSEWSLQRLLGGFADCDGQNVGLHYGSYQFYDKAVHSVTCSTLNTNSSRLTALSFKPSSGSGGGSGSDQADLSSLEIELPTFYRPTSSLLQAQHFLGNARPAVHHLASLPVLPAAAKAKAQGCADRKVLVVLHLGHTLLITMPMPCAASPSAAGSPASVQWSRLEGLARAQQAVVLDQTPAATAEGEEPRMPSFAERLMLQHQKMLDFTASGWDTVLTMVDTVRASVQRLLGGQPSSASGAAGSTAGPRKVLKKRDLQKLQSFGFDKLAAVLCYSNELASALKAGAGQGVKFSEAGLQLVFVDLLRTPSAGLAVQDEEVRSVHYLALDTTAIEEEEVVTYVKLLPSRAPASRLSSGTEAPTSTEAQDTGAAAGAAKALVLVVGTAAGRTYFWDINPSSALSSSYSSSTAGKVCSAEGSCENPQLRRVPVIRESFSVLADAAATSGAPLSVAATTAFSAPAYTILHAAAAGSDLALVTVVHDKHATIDVDSAAPIFVHFVDKTTGRLSVFKASTHKADVAACSALHYSVSTSSAHQHHQHLGLTCVPVRASASALFSPAQERIVDVTYPSAQDTVHVPYSILGDDSVLLKYLNPHVALVTTIAQASTTTASSVEVEEGAEQQAQVDTTDMSTLLYWTLVDTVTGKVILRLHQESAALPVHCILVENHIVATYWNSKAKRTELSSTALYEGVIDNTELTPFASSRARSNSAFLAATAASASSKVRSAFSSIPPIAMQKTYTLPRAVSALHHTVTAQGLSNKNLLLGLRNGQVFSLDMKQVHPRRPFSDPSTAEKTEGLVRYSPFVTLAPLSALTHNYSLPGGVANIVSAASNLESSSLVLSFGGAALDMHLNRVMPSQDFDLLSSDFNYSLLVAILLALATAVLFLRNLQQRKHLGTIWA